MSYGSDVQGHNLTPVAKPGGGDCYLVESYEQTGGPLAIPLRTSESWRPSVAGYEHALGR
jgi:hypothetical protein